MSGPAIARWVRFLGLAVVLAAAAVLSFHGLRDLALAVSIPVELAWLLPVAVDAGAGVSCACWLSRGIPTDAARFARTQTWLLLGGTVIGNAAQLGMHAAGIVPPWWVAVLVGAIPPAVVGGTIHLAVLVGRPGATATQVAVEGLASELQVAPDSAGDAGDDDLSSGLGAASSADHHLGEDRAPAVGDSPGPEHQPGDEPPAHVALHLAPTPAVAPGPGDARPEVGELLAQGAGRRTVARELGVTEYAARQLIDARRGVSG